MASSARLVRRILILILILSAPGTGHGASPGDIAPDWSLESSTGATIKFHEHSRGQVSVVLFWATWCPYCKTLMPHVQTIAREFAGQPVRFYAINVWEDGDPAAFMKEGGYSFLLLLQGEGAAAAWGVKGTPGLFVVDQDRRVRYQRVSGTDDMDVEIDLRETLNSLLAK